MCIFSLENTDAASTGDAVDASWRRQGDVEPWRGQQYFAAQDYRSVPASFSWDCGADQVLQVTLSANSTISFPTNAQRGATYILVVKQDATGSRTLSYTNQSGQQTNGS